jgi:lipopolysaccharide/colanic/teichoic acid biosynthesis glycosyltransferase
MKESKAQAGAKRTFDIVFSAVGLLVFLLPIAVISLLLLALQGRPIFFRQTRPGLNEVPFELVKFRTMVPLDARRAAAADADAGRLTRIGKWLRATSLDELPTLWNVLKGEMSFVGPRPLLMQYLALYDAEQRRRHLMRPGITGLAQVNGRNALSWEKRFEYDVRYVENWSLLLDWKIMCRTVYKVIARDGINTPGSETSPPFRRP